MDRPDGAGPERTALVTGASSGIGAATALLLGRSGYRPLLVGRDAVALAGVAARAAGRTCVADLTEAASIDRVAAVAGAVDLLVCNAGIGWAGPLVTMPVEELDRLVAVNVWSVLRLVRAVLPVMLDRGRGHIVLVSSIAGCMAVPGESAYSATKAALRGLAASLRAELAPSGIGVSVVHPGVVDTPFFTRRGAPYQRRRPRPIPPETVARAILRAATRNRAEIFVPRWLALPARLRGLAPGVTDTLQRRLDPPGPMIDPAQRDDHGRDVAG